MFITDVMLFSMSDVVRLYAAIEARYRDYPCVALHLHSLRSTSSTHWQTLRLGSLRSTTRTHRRVSRLLRGKCHSGHNTGLPRMLAVQNPT